jgi:PAS domain S-box-containing protein
LFNLILGKTNISALTRNIMDPIRKSAPRLLITMILIALVFTAVVHFYPTPVSLPLVFIAAIITGTYFIYNELKSFRKKIESEYSELINKNERRLKISGETASAAQEKLQECRLRLKMALENGNIGTWELSPDKNKVVLDRRTAGIFGLKEKEYSGSFKSLEKMVDEEDINHLQSSIQKSLKGNVPMETVVRTRSVSGKTRRISLKARLINNRKNSSVLSGVALDITDMQDGTGKMLTRLNEELLRSNSDLEKFAYIASHDLMEPLRMVTSFTQLLSKQYGDKLDSTAREYIEYATDGARRMYELLNGLLDYSRVQSRGKSFQHVKMSEVVENTLENLALIIQERNAVITADELPVVYADRNQMNQLLQNLIANSIKFSVKQPRIAISSFSRNRKHVISVKDEGIGIDPKYFDKIFEIFRRLHSREEFEGTGVGLAICKRIVERHGGSIWVESTPGKGSTFFFSIPKAN